MQVLFKPISYTDLTQHASKLGIKVATRTTENKPIIYALIIINTVTVGIISYNEFKDIYYERNLYIRDLQIFEEFRNKGYGSLTISTLIDQAIQENLFGKVRVEADNSTKFWKKFGLLETGKLNNGHPLMERVFKKTLIKPYLSRQIYKYQYY